MDNQPPTTYDPNAETLQQLAQVRVPLEQAGMTFEATDATGRTPIVVLPRRNLRVRLDLLGLAGLLILLAVVAFTFDWNVLVVPLALIGALGAAGLGTVSAFYVRVPEGTTALLVRGGRHAGVLAPGTHIVMPWLVVSHIVTRRQIPFELPPFEASTRDNVTARVDGLLTFTIADPVRFVYAIAAPDFDRVLQAASRDGLRLLLRQLSWAGVLDIGRGQTDLLRSQIEDYIEPYGVKIGHLNVTHARPQIEFLRSEEARQLATVQRAEQIERHALAECLLQDEQALERMRVTASIERAREQLQAQVHQAEIRRRATEIDADTQAFRLAHLDDLLKRYPGAAEWEWKGEQLGVARALAANNRSILNLGRAADIMTSLWPDSSPEPAHPDPSHPNGPATG